MCWAHRRHHRRRRHAGAEVLTQPIAASRRLVEGVGALVAPREENARLRDENRRLLDWQTARQLSLSRTRPCARCSTTAPTPSGRTAVTGRVIADAGGPFVHTVLINVGADHGVADGMAAVNEHGLVGRVIEVGRRSARCCC